MQKGHDGMEISYSALTLRNGTTVITEETVVSPHTTRLVTVCVCPSEAMATRVLRALDAASASQPLSQDPHSDSVSCQKEAL